MTIDTIIYLIFIVFIILVILYTRIAVKELNVRQNGISKEIDENYKALHKMQRQINELKKEFEQSSKSITFDEKMTQNCEILIDSISDEKVSKLRLDLLSFQDALNEIANNFDARLKELEKVQEPSQKLSISDDADVKAVLELYANGESIETIASKLNKSPQAINIILKSI